MADKVTAMVLKVDLQCPRCYRKIKKVLCNFPEIRDQIYDEKQNRVIVTVVTCCPDVILHRISSKGGRSVESIEIVPEKKKDGDKDKPKDAAAAGDKKKDAAGDKDKPKDAGAAGDKKKDAAGDKGKPKDAGAGDKKEDAAGDTKPKQAPPSEKKPGAQVHKDVVEPVSGFPMIYPSGMFYNNQPYYPGYGGGIPMPMPCYHGHGRPCMCYGVPAYEGYSGNRGGYSNTGRFNYFSEENPEACSIM